MESGRNREQSNGTVNKSSQPDSGDDSDSFFDAAEESDEFAEPLPSHTSNSKPKIMQSSNSEQSLHDSDSSLEYTYEKGKVRACLHTKESDEELNDEVDASAHIPMSSHEERIHKSSSGNHEIFEEADFSFDNDNGFVETSESLIQQTLTTQSNKNEENKPYRTSLPSAMFSRDDFSLWSILKQCIGKELSKITMPVIFNEPLSFLQRVCEYMEYTNLLQKASNTENSTERLQYVAAFCVSALASQLGRVGKPYNPLLGETYEFNRPDLGFRWVSEQVSHHPPISAFQATDSDNKAFVFTGSVWPKLKFWGKSVQVEPKGIMTLELKKHNETYTWSNPMCSVHNVVVGTPWIEQHGNVKITNHRTKDKCNVNFKSVGWFKGELNKVEGQICNADGEVVRYLEGDWTSMIYSLSPSLYKEYVATINPKSKKGQKKTSAVKWYDALRKISRDSSCDCQLLWTVQPRPDCSQQMYNMTEFAMSLNEMHSGQELVIAPTDTRFRPDIRAQESGDIELAGGNKHTLEEKQRNARRNRAKQKEEFTPRWFDQKKHPHADATEWFYNGKYEHRNWEEIGTPEWFCESSLD